MTTKVIAALQQYEKMIEAGKITTFFVYIQGDGILIQHPGTDTGQQVPLIEEVITPLHAFFYDLERIEYGSFDYTNLRSFLNTDITLGGPHK